MTSLQRTELSEEVTKMGRRSCVCVCVWGGGGGGGVAR